MDGIDTCGMHPPTRHHTRTLRALWTGSHAPGTAQEVEVVAPEVEGGWVGVHALPRAQVPATGCHNNSNGGGAGLSTHNRKYVGAPMPGRPTAQRGGGGGDDISGSRHVHASRHGQQPSGRHPYDVSNRGVHIHDVLAEPGKQVAAVHQPTHSAQHTQRPTHTVPNS